MLLSLSADEDVGQQNSDSLLVEMQYGPATVEDSLAVPTKLCILFPCDPAIVLLGIDLKRVENLCPHRHLHRCL